MPEINLKEIQKSTLPKMQNEILAYVINKLLVAYENDPLSETDTGKQRTKEAIRVKAIREALAFGMSELAKVQTTEQVNALLNKGVTVNVQ